MPEVPDTNTFVVFVVFVDVLKSDGSRRKTCGRQEGHEATDLYSMLEISDDPEP